MNSLSSLAGMPVAALIQHRGSMLLLDTLLAVDETRAVCEWRLAEQCALMIPGKGVPIYAAIECMAQCIAAHAGAKARLRGLAPPLGLLLGTRQFSASIRWMQVGQSYQVECDELLRDGQGMASFDCKMSHLGQTIVSSRLAVFEKESGKRLNES